MVAALSHPGTGPNGTTVDATNSALTGDTVTPAIGASATLIYSSAQTIHQSTAFAITTGASAVNCNLPWTLPAAVPTLYFRGYLRTPSSFAVAPSIARILSGGAGGSQAARLAWNAAGNVLIRDSGNVTRATSTNAMTTSTWYRVEGFVTQGATGTAEIKFWTGASIDSTGAPTETLTAASFNFGAVNVDTVTWGQVAGLANVPTWYLADTWLTDFGYVGPTAQGQQLVLPERWQPVRPLAWQTVPEPATVARASLSDPTPPVTGPTVAPVVATTPARPATLPRRAQIVAPPLGYDARPPGTAPTVRTVSGRAPVIPVPARFAHPLQLGGLPPVGQPFLPGILDGYLAVEIAWGADLTDLDESSWVWTDVTHHVMYDNRVSISVLRTDETGDAPSASCSFTLLNDGSDYSAYNPLSSNYPYVRKNTPVRVSVDPDGTGIYFVRFQGGIPGFPPGWDITGRLPIVTINANGALRRLEQGSTPLAAPVTRAALADGPVAAWMLDDGSEATSLTSALGGPSMTAGGATVGVTDAGLAGAGAVISLGVDPNHPTALVPAYAVGTSMSLRTWFKWELNGDSATSSDHFVHLNFAGSGTLSYLYLTMFGAGFPPAGVGAHLFGTSGGHWSFDTGLGSPGLIDPFDGEWHEVLLTLEPTGPDLTGTLYIDGVFGASALMGESLSPVSSVYLANNMSAGVNVEAFYSAVTIYNKVVSPAYDAGSAYAGENCIDRMERLSAEQGVPFTALGTSELTMGPQQVDSYVNLMRAAEAVDGGILYDGLSSGLIHQPGQVRYNAVAVMTLDMAGDPPEVSQFSPADDDQRLRNTVTVTRTGSSGTTATDRDGPLGTDAVGVYDTSLELNVETDDGTVDQAGIRLRQGTVEGMRFPTLGLDLAAVPGKVTEWLHLPALGRVDVDNASVPASGIDPQQIQQLAEGWSEVLGGHEWTATLNASPFRPWEVFVIEHARLGRLTTDGSELHATIGENDTSMTVDITDGPSWITTAANPTKFPVDIVMNGEQITVGAIADVSGTRQTFSSMTRAVNGIVRSHVAGSAIQVWRPGALRL